MLIGILAAAVATTLAVIGKTKGPQWLHYAGKPLILPPLLAAVLLLPSLLPANAHLFLVFALVLAWVGDVALMFGKREFMIGLVSFLFAHVAYVVCFTLESTWALGRLLWLLPIFPLAYFGLRGVLAHVGRLKVPVVIYASALTLVAWQLLARITALEQLGMRSWILGFAGGLLFILADSLLVRRRFAGAKIPYWLELGSYSASQVCIVAATVSLG